MPCYVEGNLVICTGPSGIETIKVEDAGIKWCFRCRKRVRFTDTLLDYTEPSYYDPWWQRECEHGHFNGDMFPS